MDLVQVTDESYSSKRYGDDNLDSLGETTAFISKVDDDSDDLNHIQAAINKNDEKNNLSTFQGVFVPCILGIVGVILFERLGWVVGQAGLYLALLILGCAYAVATITTLSVSAIATNGNMKGGGAYFMISRSLGPAFGGSVGVVFFFANISSGGTCILGFVEVVQAIAPEGFWQTRLGGIAAGSIALFILFVICIVGAGAYAKAAIFIFIAMWFAIFSVLGSFAFLPEGWNDTPSFTSWSAKTYVENQGPGYSDEEDFQSVFAVFFPAVTGIMAGANMSGDLENPGKSIPRGTLAAVLLTGCLYAGLMFMMAATVTRTGLQEIKLIMGAVCYWPPIIVVGIVASSLSSALGALIGASRILQALARDELIPLLSPFGVGSTKGDEPRRAVLFTYILIQITVFAPSVNFMATITSMFFLLSYGSVNLACFVLRITGSPNFRPTFRYFDPWLSLAGAVMCIAAMLYVNFVASVFSILFMAVLYLIIMWRGVPTNWGDVSQALLYHQVRKYLLMLDVRRQHVKYWRPQIQLFVRDPTQNLNLITFMNNLKKGGLFMMCSVVAGDYRVKGAALEEYQRRWLDFIDEQQLKAFPEIVLSSSTHSGMETLLFASGIGAMKPNTIVFGFPRLAKTTKTTTTTPTTTTPHGEVTELSGSFAAVEATFDSNNEHTTIPEPSLAGDDYVSLIREAIFFKKNVLIARNFEVMDRQLIVQYRGSRYLRRRQRLTIDMWPFVPTPGDHSYESSITLSLLLGWILKQTDIWTVYSKLRVKGYCVTPAGIGPETRRLQALCDQARVPSKVHVVALTDSHVPAFEQAMRESKRDPESCFAELSNYERYKIIATLIRHQSTTTCVTFVTMPHVDSEVDSDQYLQNLDALTTGLPPVVLVHASNSVVTNEL